MRLKLHLMWLYFCAEMGDSIVLIILKTERSLVNCYCSDNFYNAKHNVNSLSLPSKIILSADDWVKGVTKKIKIVELITSQCS